MAGLVLVGMTRFLIVGRGAEASMVHPEVEDVGHSGVLSVGVYDALATPVGIRVSH